MEPKSMSKQLRACRTLIYIFFGILTLLSLIPFIYMLVNSTRSLVQITSGVSLLPGSSLAHNLQILKGYGMNMWQGMGNSAFISITSTAISVYFSALSAYALTAYDFKGKKIIYGFIIALIMIPGQVSMIGFYKFMIQLNLLDNYIPLILPAICAPASIFFLCEYMSTVYNKDYADSARLDGASELKIFHRIMLPMMKPGLATMGIFGFIFSWNNFMMPLILITNQKLYTLPMQIQVLTANGGGGHVVEWGTVYVGVSIAIAPTILAYLLLSRFIIGGGNAGGVKG
ncbi:carbohydrate ABC transporter permease [Lactococcus lactis subsp. lactis]|uniref:Carbohydrate ABC transporter membrane protein 2 CUT1 family n=2 Tax=Lactococcus lactis TaxID=1358 RepID=A0AAC9R6B1_LACLL|nr:carbohydrate ABC transporter permease [Lactococcus lactis]ARE13598.1 carbohydrate ABC transporter permease [Lactococcus lactis subsp. lactis]ARE16009.1 carbohydrate ABC transporter permease [Lactococcus lactis subsp. lactis]